MVNTILLYLTAGFAIYTVFIFNKLNFITKIMYLTLVVSGLMLSLLFGFIVHVITIIATLVIIAICMYELGKHTGNEPKNEE